MNKAFVREPDEGDPRCPACGAIGVPVSPQTLAAHAGAEARKAIDTVAWFCPGSGCGVAYYDAFGQSIRTEHLMTPVFPKDQSAPVCPCLGIRADQIAADAAAKDPTRVRQILLNAESSADCVIRCPTGQSCAGDVQRLYLQHLSKR